MARSSGNHVGSELYSLKKHHFGSICGLILTWPYFLKGFFDAFLQLLYVYQFYRVYYIHIWRPSVIQYLEF